MPILVDVSRVFAITLVLNALQIVPITKLMVVDFKTQVLVGAVAILFSKTGGQV